MIKYNLPMIHHNKDMNKYQREGKNAHDDAPDCTTGVYETKRPNNWEISYKKLF